MTLADFFEQIYCPLRLINRSSRTKTLYRYSIRLFGFFLKREPTLADLTDINVARHLESLIQAGRAPAGVNKERAQLLALWNLAAKKRLVSDYPQIPSVHQPESLPLAWTLDEMWRLKISCNMQPGEYRGVPACLWWVTIHHVLYDTGERISAVIQSEWSHLSGNKIVFPAKNRKGGKRNNVCDLSRETCELLEIMRKPVRRLIFDWPFSTTYLYRVYAEILQRAELADCAKSKFHRMRRSHATHLKVAGGDPSTSLGHANPATTFRYIDPRFIDSGVSLLSSFGIK